MIIRQLNPRKLARLVEPRKETLYRKAPPADWTPTVNLFLVDGVGPSQTSFWRSVVGLGSLLKEDYPELQRGTWAPSRIRFRLCELECAVARSRETTQHAALRHREVTPLFFVPEIIARRFAGIPNTWTYWYAPGGNVGRLADLPKPTR